MNNSKLIYFALRNTAGLALYVGFVAMIMANGNRIFGTQAPNYLSMMAFLMLFVLSALICSVLVLGQPVLLYLRGQKAESVKLLGYTAATMFIFTVLVLAALAM